MRIILFFSFLFITSAFAADSKVKCLKAGESEYHGGVPPRGAFEKLAPCCPGLVSGNSLEMSPVGNGDCPFMVGGYGHACLPCGNGKCETKYENKCNCPEDCKN